MKSENFHCGDLKDTFHGVSYSSPSSSYSNLLFLAIFSLWLPAMMLKINKFIRNYSAVTDIWRTKMGGSLCFLLCRFQKMFIKLITIKQFWENHVKEDLNCPFGLLDLYLKLFPTLLSLFTSDLQFQLTSHQVYFSCPIGKSKAVCSKSN